MINIQAQLEIAAIKGLDSERIKNTFRTGSIRTFSDQIETAIGKVANLTNVMLKAQSAGIKVDGAFKDMRRGLALLFGGTGASEFNNIAAALQKIFSSFASGQSGIGKTRSELVQLRKTLFEVLSATGLSKSEANDRAGSFVQKILDQLGLSKLDSSNIKKKLQDLEKFRSEIQKNTDQVRKAIEKANQAEIASVKKRFSSASSTLDQRDKEDKLQLAKDTRAKSDFIASGIQGARDLRNAEINAINAVETERRKSLKSQSAAMKFFVREAKNELVILKKSLEQLNSTGISSNEIASVRSRLTSAIEDREKFLSGSNVGGRSQDPLQDPKKLQQVTKEIVNQSIAYQKGSLSAKAFGESTALAFKRFGAFVIGAAPIYGIINALRSGVTNAIEFEKQMTKIQQVLEISDKSTNNIAKSIKDAAKFSGQSANEIAAGVNIFAQAGQRNPSDLANVADVLAKTQLAPTFDDIATTADGLLAIFGQFNKELSDTGRILDLVNQFAADFAVESKDIFEGVKRGGSAFSAAGGQLEDFIQLFTLLRSASRESADSLGVFFKTGVAKLLTERSQTILGNLGVTSGPQNLVDQLKEFANISKNIDTIDLIRISEELVGERQFNRFLTILKALGDPKKSQAIEESFRKSFGSLDRSTADRLNDIGTNIAKVRETFNAFITDITQSEALKTFVSTITSLTSGLIELTSAFKAIIPIIGIFLARLAVRTGAGALGGFVDRSLGIPPTLNRREKIAAILGSSRRSLNPRDPAIISSALLAGGIGLSSFGGDSANIQTGSSGLIGAGTGAGVASILGVTNPIILAGAAIAGALTSISSTLEDIRITKLNRELEAAQGARPSLAGIVANQRSESLPLNSNTITRFLTGDGRRIRDKQIISGIISGNTEGKAASDIILGVTDEVRKKLINDIKNNKISGPQASNLIFDEVFKIIDNLFIDIGDPLPEQFLKDAILTVFNKEKIEKKLSEAFNKAEPVIRASVISAAINFGTVLRNILEDLSNEVKSVTDDVSIKSSLLDTVRTSTNDKGRLFIDPRSGGLLNQSGIGTGVNDLIKTIQNELQSIFKDSGFRALFEEAFISGQQTQDVTDASGVFKLVNSIAKNASTLSGSSLDVTKTTDQITTIVEVLKELSGKNVTDIVKGLGDTLSGGGSINDFVDSLAEGIKNGLNQVEEVIRSNIDLMYREVEIRGQLLDQQRSFNQSLFDLSNTLKDNANILFDRILEQNQFSRGGNPLSNLIQSGLNQFQRSAGSSFGDPVRFGNDLISALEQVRKDNLDRINNTGESIQQQQERFRNEQNNLQISNNLQQELGQRLTEFSRRIDFAARSTDILRQAVTEFKGQIIAAGQAVQGFTVNELQDSFNVFDKFINGGGLNDAGRGLDALRPGDLDILNRLLTSFGGFNLGGGISGQKLLEDINFSLGLPLLSAARGRITGETQQEASDAIVKEFQDLKKQQALSAAQEKLLREQQLSLLKIQEKALIINQQVNVDNLLNLNNISTNTKNSTDKLIEIANKMDIIIRSSVSTTTPIRPLPVGPPEPEIPELPRRPFPDEERQPGSNYIPFDRLSGFDDKLNRYTDTLGTILEKMSERQLASTNVSLDVKPIQVNVVLSAPDVLALAGEPLYKAIMARVGPAISNALGIIGTEPKSVFEAGIA